MYIKDYWKNTKLYIIRIGHTDLKKNQKELPHIKDVTTEIRSSAEVLKSQLGSVERQYIIDWRKLQQIQKTKWMKLQKKY